jgi:flagellar hook-associated protein 2
MSTSISTTGSVSSAGVGSGLDVESIVTKLMEVEKAPLTALQTKATGIQTKVSAFAALKSAISTFRDAARALTTPSTWAATTGTSGDASTVTASSTGTAAAGSYAITVQSLAAGQSVASGTFAASTALVGEGTMHIDTGSWTAGAFTAQSGSTGLDITVAATDTLANVRDKINSAKAGVTASIVTDTTGSRLVMSSTTTGAANAFRVTTADTDGSNTNATGLSALAYDPAGGTTATSLTQTAANAKATVNGLTVTSATNALSGAVEGMTLNLVKVNATPVLVTVAPDTTSISAAISTFATAYSSLATLLTTDTKYDAATSTAGPLQADTTAVSIQSQLRSVLGASSTASSMFSTLSQAGLEIQSDGTLKVNSSKLTTSLGNLGQLKSLFANVDSSGATQDGFAQRMRSLADAMLSTDGLLTNRTTGLATSISDNTKRQTEVQARLARTESRLRAQYTALDTKMATLTTLSTYVTQQIASWNKSTG